MMFNQQQTGDRAAVVRTPEERTDMQGEREGRDKNREEGKEQGD